MNYLLRRSLAIVGGMLVVILSLIWALVAAGRINSAINSQIGSPAKGGADLINNDFGDNYTFLGILGLGIAGGVSLVALFWDRNPIEKRAPIIYGTFLALVLPLSVINYFGGDQLVSRWKQAALDVVLVFLGAMCVVYLIRIKLHSTTAHVLRAMAVFFVVGQAVLIPALYAILWWLNWQNAITRSQAEGWSPSWISSLAAIGSLIVASLTYHRTSASSTSMPAQGRKSSILRP